MWLSVFYIYFPHGAIDLSVVVCDCGISWSNTSVFTCCETADVLLYKFLKDEFNYIKRATENHSTFI